MPVSLLLPVVQCVCVSTPVSLTARAFLYKLKAGGGERAEGGRGRASPVHLFLFINTRVVSQYSLSARALWAAELGERSPVDCSFRQKKLPLCFLSHFPIAKRSPLFLSFSTFDCTRQHNMANSSRARVRRFVLFCPLRTAELAGSETVVHYSGLI